jgi:hypothetical protein
METSTYLFFVLTLASVYSEAQTPPSLSFYPYRAGNIWQYGDAFNNEVLYTRYNDYDSVGADGAIYIRGRRVPESPLYEKNRQRAQLI